MPKKVKYPRRKQNSQSTDDEGMSEIPDRPQVPGQPVCSCSPKKTKEARSYFRSRSKDTSTGSMTTDTSGQRTEDNARSTPGTYRAGDIELSDFSQDSLSKRGILKRSFRRDDHIRESGLGMHMDPGQHTFQTQAMVHEPPTSERQAEHAGTSGLCRESSTPGQQPRPSDDANMQNTIRFLNGYHDDIVHALQNAASKRPYHFSECNEQAKGRFVCKGANFKRSHSQEPLSNDGRGHFHGMVDSKTIRRPASAMHRREDCYDEMTRSRSSSQHELEKGAIRIRNIEDLIRQLEQHSQRHSGQRGCVAARIIRTKQKGKCMCSCGAETARSSRQGLNATDKGEGECQAGCRGECGDEFKFVFGTFKCPKSRQSSHQKGQSSENADYHDKSNRCLHIDLEIQNADSSDEFVCPQYPLSRSASEELMAIVQTPQNSRHGSPTTLSRSSRRGTPCPCSVSPAQEHPPVAHSRHRDDIPSTSKFNMPPGPSFCNINTSKLSSMSAGRGSLFGLNRGPGDFSQSPNANFSRLQSDTVAHTSNLMRMPEGHGFPTYHRTMPEGTPNLSTFQRPSVSTVSSLQTVPTLSTPANATHRLTGHLPSTYHRHSEDLPSTSTFRRGQNNEQSLATSSLRRITSLLTRHPHGEREDRSTSGGQIHKPEKYPEYKH